MTYGHASEETKTWLGDNAKHLIETQIGPITEQDDWIGDAVERTTPCIEIVCLGALDESFDVDDDAPLIDMVSDIAKNLIKDCADFEVTAFLPNHTVYAEGTDNGYEIWYAGDAMERGIKR